MAGYLSPKVWAIIFFLLGFRSTKAQTAIAFADSIRVQYKIPELGYAVVSSSEVLEMATIGVKRVNTAIKATLNDKFRIGSNTKAITGFIAAQLVKQGKIKWDTKFFDLFPEMKTKSRKVHYNLTLLNLLTFRAKLFPYSYTSDQPTKDQFAGDEAEQRCQFTAWVLQQKPVKGNNGIAFSNLGYVAAALMLEKVSGKSYKTLVKDLGLQLGIDFGFGNPNFSDSLQTWGHNSELMPEPPGDNYKLNWLLPAGNINVSLPDYTKFIQLQLKGLMGKSDLLTKEEFYFLHFGLPEFSVGWFWLADENKKKYSYNIGNPGTFLTKVFLFSESNKAFILFANAQTIDADTGLDILLAALKKQYGL